MNISKKFVILESMKTTPSCKALLILVFAVALAIRLNAYKGVINNAMDAAQFYAFTINALKGHVIDLGSGYQGLSPAYLPAVPFLMATAVTVARTATPTETLILMRTVACVIDALLVFPIYALAAKLRPTTGVVAAFFAVTSTYTLGIYSWSAYATILGFYLNATFFALVAKKELSTAEAYAATLLATATALTHRASPAVLLSCLTVYTLVKLALTRKLPKEILPLVAGAATIAVEVPFYGYSIGISTLRNLVMPEIGNPAVKNASPLPSTCQLTGPHIDWIFYAFAAFYLSSPLQLILAIIGLLYLYWRKNVYSLPSVCLAAWFLTPHAIALPNFLGYFNRSRFILYLAHPLAIFSGLGVYALFRAVNRLAALNTHEYWRTIQKAKLLALISLLILIISTLTVQGAYATLATAQYVAHSVSHSGLSLSEYHALSFLNSSGDALASPPPKRVWWLSVLVASDRKGVAYIFTDASTLVFSDINRVYSNQNWAIYRNL